MIRANGSCPRWTGSPASNYDPARPTFGGQRSNFRPRRSNFSSVQRHTNAKLEGPTPTRKTQHAFFEKTHTKRTFHNAHAPSTWAPHQKRCRGDALSMCTAGPQYCMQTNPENLKNPDWKKSGKSKSKKSGKSKKWVCAAREARGAHPFF